MEKKRRKGRTKAVTEDVHSKYEKILRASIKVFAQNGFHRSKISQIAKEAGIADGTIYLYFKNKDDILIKIFEDRLEKNLAELKSKLEKIEDPYEQLKFFISHHLALFDTNRGLIEVLTVELRMSNKFMKEYVPQRFGEYLNLLSGIIRRGKDKGIFRPDVMPGVAKRVIYGALDGILVYLILAPKPKYDLNTCVDQITSIMVSGLLKK